MTKWRELSPEELKAVQERHKASLRQVKGVISLPLDKRFLDPPRRSSPKYQLYLQDLHPELTAEYVFYPGRKWRFDYAIPSLKVGLEIDGGIFTQGRHSRGKGMLNDFDKLNHAARDGWAVFRFSPQQVKSGEARTFLQSVIALRTSG